MARKVSDEKGISESILKRGVDYHLSIFDAPMQIHRHVVFR